MRRAGRAHDVVDTRRVKSAIGEHAHAGVEQPAHRLAALRAQLARAARAARPGARPPDRRDDLYASLMIPTTVAEAARRFGDRIAYVTESGWSLSYDDIDRISDEIAAGLAREGVREGDVVALVLPPGPEYLLAYCATPSSARSPRA